LETGSHSAPQEGTVTCESPTRATLRREDWETCQLKCLSELESEVSGSESVEGRAVANEHRELSVFSTEGRKERKEGRKDEGERYLSLQ
jgi:hypothetical protein